MRPQSNTHNIWTFDIHELIFIIKSFYKSLNHIYIILLIFH